MVDDLLTGARFFLRLPSFLCHWIRLDEAEVILRRRLERREEDFLALVRRNIYEHPQSPYRQLLTLAGCEYGDLEKLVRQDGLEEALQTLLHHGAYLTVDEFKGRRPATRGSATIAVDPSRLRNSSSAFQVTVRSSGSRGEGTSVPTDLGFSDGLRQDPASARRAENGRCRGREDLGTMKWAMIEDLVAGAKCFFRLPSFLRRTVNVEEARAILCRRLVPNEASGGSERVAGSRG